MPNFFTNDNLITTLCSVYIQLHQLTAFDWYQILRFFVYAIHVDAYWGGSRTPATSKMEHFVAKKIADTFPEKTWKKHAKKKNEHCDKQIQ